MNPAEMCAGASLAQHIPTMSSSSLFAHLPCPSAQLNAKRITSLSISLAGGNHLQKDGEYRLGLDWIAARNTRLHEYEQLERGDEVQPGGSSDATAGEASSGGSSSEGSRSTAAKGWWEDK